MSGGEPNFFMEIYHSMFLQQKLINLYATIPEIIRLGIGKAMGSVRL